MKDLFFSNDFRYDYYHFDDLESVVTCHEACKFRMVKFSLNFDYFKSIMAFSNAKRRGNFVLLQVFNKRTTVDLAPGIYFELISKI